MFNTANYVYQIEALTKRCKLWQNKKRCQKKTNKNHLRCVALICNGWSDWGWRSDLDGASGCARVCWVSMWKYFWFVSIMAGDDLYGWGRETEKERERERIGKHIHYPFSDCVFVCMCSMCFTLDEDEQMEWWKCSYRAIVHQVDRN